MTNIKPDEVAVLAPRSEFEDLLQQLSAALAEGRLVDQLGSDDEITAARDDLVRVIPVFASLGAFIEVLMGPDAFGLPPMARTLNDLDPDTQVVLTLAWVLVSRLMPLHEGVDRFLSELGDEGARFEEMRMEARRFREFASATPALNKIVSPKRTHQSLRTPEGSARLTGRIRQARAAHPEQFQNAETELTAPLETDAPGGTATARQPTEH